MAYEIKERSIGEIVDGSFQLYRNHFGVLVGIALCVAVPSALAVSLVTWLIIGNAEPTVLQAVSQPPPAGDAPPPDVARAMQDLARSMQSSTASLLNFVIHLISSVLQDAALTVAVADAYLGRPLSVRSSLRRCLPMFGALLGATLIKGLGIGLGLVCLIVPGILLMLRWLLSTQAIIVEAKGARASLARSRELTAQNYGRLLLLTLVMMVIGMALNFGLRTLLPDSVERVPVLGQLLQQVYQVMVAPLSAAALTLVYFDLRVRQEGFDLERLAVGLGEGDGTGPLAPHAT